jgi:hypothetical protein
MRIKPETVRGKQHAPYQGHLRTFKACSLTTINETHALQRNIWRCSIWVRATTAELCVNAQNSRHKPTKMLTMGGVSRETCENAPCSFKPFLRTKSRGRIGKLTNYKWWCACCNGIVILGKGFGMYRLGSVVTGETGFASGNMPSEIELRFDVWWLNLEKLR